MIRGTDQIYVLPLIEMIIILDSINYYKISNSPCIHSHVNFYTQNCCRPLTQATSCYRLLPCTANVVLPRTAGKVFGSLSEQNRVGVARS